MGVIRVLAVPARVHDVKWWFAAGPTSAAVQHFAGLGHPTPVDVNVADMVLDLVIKSPV